MDIVDKHGNDIDLWDDKYVPYIEGHKGVEYTIIKDYDNNIFYFGQVIGHTNDDWDFNEIDVDLIDAEKTEKLFDELFECDIPKGSPILFITSHYN